jgi:hypothetical protein
MEEAGQDVNEESKLKQLIIIQSQRHDSPTFSLHWGKFVVVTREEENRIIIISPCCICLMLFCLLLALCNA